MKNLKDTLTTICGVLIFVSGTILTISHSGINIPAEWVTISNAIGVAAASVLAYMTGKNPDGSTKSADQVATQNQQSKALDPKP